jgi:hypothetical protein
LDSAIVKRTGKRGDEINAALPPAFQETSTWDLDDNLDLRQLLVHVHTMLAPLYDNDWSYCNSAQSTAFKLIPQGFLEVEKYINFGELYEVWAG